MDEINNYNLLNTIPNESVILSIIPKGRQGSLKEKDLKKSKHQKTLEYEDENNIIYKCT